MALKNLLRDQATQNVLALVGVAAIFFGVGAGLHKADYDLLALVLYGLAVSLAIVAAVGAVLLLIEHFSASVARFNILRKYRLAWPVRAVGVAAHAPWIASVIQFDSDNLRAALHMVGDLQHGHVVFDVQHETSPSIYFRFEFVNASVYTIALSGISGALGIEDKWPAGHFELRNQNVATQLVTATHARRFLLEFRFLIDTESSVNAIRQLLSENRRLYLNLDSVKVDLVARQNESIRAELRFPQQLWEPAFRDMLTIDDWYGANAIQMRASVVGHPGIAVLRFQLESDDQAPIAMADYHEREHDGMPILSDGRMAAIARRNAAWLSVPLHFNIANVHSGWIGFIPSGGMGSVGRNLRLVALLSDGRELRTPAPTPREATSQ